MSSEGLPVNNVVRTNVELAAKRHAIQAEQSLTLPKDGSLTIRVPLVARYIHTAERPTPGKANGKVTFTINYY